MSPIWFSEDDDEQLTKIVESLNTSSGEDNLIINQIKNLLTNLCHLKNTPLPQFSELETPRSSNHLVIENKKNKKNLYLIYLRTRILNRTVREKFWQ